MSTTVTVSNSVQLAAALKAAATTTTPETIVLEAGTYSKVGDYEFNPTANVTIESASTSNEAVVQGLELNNSSNLTFKNIAFTSAPGQVGGYVASSANGSNINFYDDSFTGPATTSSTSAPNLGLYVSNSTNTTISGSQFEYVQDGLAEVGDNGITISGNSFSNIYGDGIDNAGSSNVQILSNSFTNMHIDPTDGQASADILFRTIGQTNAGSNITISGNTYNIGTGAAVQGVVMADQIGDLTYSNVTIENNNLVGTGSNGIALQHVSGATVENNTLQSVSSTGQISRLTLNGGVTGLIENNQVGALVTAGVNTATVSANTTLAAISLQSAAQSGLTSAPAGASAPNTSATVTVSNSVQLAAALKAAATTTTQETIVLEAGTYSKVGYYKFNPTANVTVESASTSNEAVVQGLELNNSSNLTFKNIAFTSAPGQVGGYVASSASGSNINFYDDSFTGPATTSYSSAPDLGLYISNSTNSIVTGSQFQYVQNGLAEEGDNGITISGNSFSNIFGDGIDNAGSSNVQILSNSFTNMHIDPTDGQHSDDIQFWTTGQTNAGSNITISGNTYNIGTGEAVQGIFMTDQVGDLTYSNVTIENNVLVGTGWNGITLQHVSGATVENNTLQTVSSTDQTSRLTLDGGVTGLIENNKIGALITAGVNTATVSANATLAAISLQAAAQSLVSSIASVASSAASATSVPNMQLAEYNAYLGAHPLATPAA